MFLHYVGRPTRAHHSGQKDEAERSATAKTIFLWPLEAKGLTACIAPYRPQMGLAGENGFMQGTNYCSTYEHLLYFGDVDASGRVHPKIHTSPGKAHGRDLCRKALWRALIVCWPDQQVFQLNEKHWKAFQAALDAPPKG